MKKLSLVIAGVLLVSGISFAQTAPAAAPAKTAPAKAAPAKTEKKEGKKKGTKKGTKKAANTGTKKTAK